MHKAKITLFNDTLFELIIKRESKIQEIWLAATLKRRRVLVEHHLTHDKVFERLCYTSPGDINWVAASKGDCKFEHHQNLFPATENTGQVNCMDYEKLGLPINCHLDGSTFITPSQTSTKLAKENLLGTWSDGRFQLEFQPKHQYRALDTCLDANMDRSPAHSFLGADWWNFCKWRLFFLSQRTGRGWHCGVINATKTELHLFAQHPYRIAQVFKRG